MLTIALGLGALCGCVTPPKQRSDQKTGPEITGVVCHYDLIPFRSFDRAGDPDVEGFEVVVGLYSQQARREVAKDGVIHMKMYRLDTVTPGKQVRTLVREWSVDTTGLPLFHAPLYGDGYKLQFIWAPEDDVLGREVEFVTSFETPDGRRIQGKTSSFKVPAAKRG